MYVYVRVCGVEDILAAYYESEDMPLERKLHVE